MMKTMDNYRGYLLRQKKISATLEQQLTTTVKSTLLVVISIEECADESNFVLVNTSDIVLKH